MAYVKEHAPSEVYHLAKKENLNNILDDGMIRRFSDTECWFCADLQKIRLRMENTGKVTGVFDLDFDKQEFSAVHIMDGWTTWAMRDVSTAAYRAVQKQYASEDVMWRKLLDHLNGKELTSAGHLTAQNFSFSDEILMENGKLNFYVQAEFDVDAAFGTFVCTDANDDWLNIYANYDIAQGRPCDTLELNLCKGDGTEENWSYAKQETSACSWILPEWSLCATETWGRLVWQTKVQNMKNLSKIFFKRLSIPCMVGDVHTAI